MYEYTMEWFEILERKPSYYNRLLEGNNCCPWA
jgi:hypothetical protein